MARTKFELGESTCSWSSIFFFFTNSALYIFYILQCDNVIYILFVVYFVSNIIVQSFYNITLHSRRKPSLNVHAAPYTTGASIVTCFARQFSRLSRRIPGYTRLNFYFSISGRSCFLPTATRRSVGGSRTFWQVRLGQGREWRFRRTSFVRATHTAILRSGIRFVAKTEIRLDS